MNNTSQKSALFTSISNTAGRVPTPMASLALGIASLGWVLENTAQFGGAAQLTGAALAAALLIGVAGKFLLHPTLIFKEMHHPVLGSIMPTLAMGLMVISKALSLEAFGPTASAVGEKLWLAAIALHFFFLIGFICCQARSFNFSTMVPSWFVPPVGIITAAITCPNASFAPFATLLLLFGLANFTLLLPLMLYRLIFYAKIAEAARPTIAILAAPASLSLAGYLSIAQTPSLIVVAILLGLALLLTTAIYIYLASLLRLPFTPAYAAFTFPLVISATALFKAMELFAANPLTTGYANLLRGLATTELAVAACIVTYVSALYLLAGSRAMLCRSKI